MCVSGALSVPKLDDLRASTTRFVDAKARCVELPIGVLPLGGAVPLSRDVEAIERKAPLVETILGNRGPAIMAIAG
jgi:hypothetical protein